ncbi:hypothetical protein N327_07940, partial [Fulmarus glacialis]
KTLFFMVPLQEKDKEKFAFTWEGIQCTFNRLPQRYKPTIAHAALAKLLQTNKVEIPPEKCQGPSKEVKFLGTWWIAGSATVPPDTISKIEQLQMPQSKKELQQLIGTLGYWKKHIPKFPVIAHPVYSLLRKGKPWTWSLEHEEAVKTVVQKLKTYQSLGPVHSHDPVTPEWSFAEHGTYCHLFQ